ncbi:MAG: aminotransferase class V-fold PLP-dependent enzyme [Planctomycetota bacterium]
MIVDTTIYLDHGATSWPKPEYVYQKGIEYWKQFGANPGRGSYSLAHQTHKMIEETRWRVARLFNLEAPEQVIFTLNATDSLNIAIKGIMKTGDLVAISPLEHNAVARPLEALKTKGVRYEILPHNQTGKLEVAEVEKWLISNRPALCVLNHCSNVNGTLQPLKELAPLFQKYQIPLMIDAAQSAGTIPINFKETPVTAMAISAHKALQGPTGVGLLLLGSKTTPLRTLKEGGTGSFSEDLNHPTRLPDHFEAGTLNVMGIAFLKAALEHLQQVGFETVFARKKELSQMLYHGLSRLPKIQIWGDPDLGVLSVRVEGFSGPHEISEILSQSFQIATRSGLHCAPLAHQTLKTFPLGTVRLTPGFTNSLHDIERTLDAFNEIVKEI